MNIRRNTSLSVFSLRFHARTLGRRYLRLGCAACILLSCGLSSHATSAEWLYTVRPGDTFWDLCLRYTTKKNCWQELPDLNQVTRTRQLPPGYIIRIPVSWLKQAPKPVSVEYLSGDVFISSDIITTKNASETAAQLPSVSGLPAMPTTTTTTEGHAEDTRTRLNIGDKIAIGSTITTEDGYASLRFGDNSTLLVLAYSAVVMDAFTTHDDEFIVDSQMRLLEGRVKAKVQQREPRTRFNITTPDAVAAVRGTEFQVSTQSTRAGNAPTNAGTRIEVFEGLVAVANDESEHDVAQGFGVHASKESGMTQPKALLNAPTLTPPPAAVSLPFTLEWQPLAEAQSYQLDVFTQSQKEGSPETLQLHLQQEATRKQLVDLPPQCYWVEISAIDTQQFQGMTKRHELCVADTIHPPLLEESNRRIDQAQTAHLSWQPIAHALQYEVQVAADKQFSQILLTRTVSDAEIHIPLSQTSYVRVRSIGEKQQLSAEYSNTLSLKPKDSDWQGIVFIALAFLIGL